MTDYQVVYKGILHDAQGFAVAARGYLLALEKAGVDVVAAPVNLGTLPVKMDKDIYMKIVELSNKKIYKKKKTILIYHLQPWGIEQELHNYDYIISNTVFEADRIINQWVDLLKDVDQVWVPSSHNYDSFKNSGVKTPIHIFPHGVDDIYKPTGERIDFGAFNGKFKFLTVARWDYRKGLPVLLQAFWEEFRDNDNVCLILKVHWHMNKESLIQKLVELKSIAVGGKNTAKVLVLCDYFDDPLMVKLYNSCDCFVLPTRGEGFGLPYLEAMACGKPVIATGWGGQTDFLNSDNSYVLKYELEKIDMSENNTQLFFRDYMKLAEPDGEHLKSLMRHVYQNQEEAGEKGKRAMQDTTSYRWENSALKMKEVLDKLVGSAAR